jgi:uncharacterized membrane protein YhaH (DUF805 family)
VILAICDGGVLIYGLIILIQPNALLELGFESHTGDSWAAFQSDAPLLGEYFSLVVRMLGAYNLAFGILALGIILKPFREGKRWAWWSLLLGNVLAYGVPVSADLYVGSIGFFEVIELIMVPLIVLALAVTARESLGHGPPPVQ